MVKPSQRKEMAQQAVATNGVSVRLACTAFKISETCYRYQAALSDENAEIADWLIKLTEEESDWGFGQCFHFLRNVEHKSWNHKRVYRIYCKLALNLRIKPKRRLKRQAPEPLKEPIKPDQVWSMDFMHDQLSDGRWLWPWSVHCPVRTGRGNDCKRLIALRPLVRQGPQNPS